MPVKGFFRPSGAPCRTRLFPWLAPWATFSRPSGADAHESYQQNVETPDPSEARTWPPTPGYRLLTGCPLGRAPIRAATVDQAGFSALTSGNKIVTIILE